MDDEESSTDSARYDARLSSIRRWTARIGSEHPLCRNTRCVAGKSGASSYRAEKYLVLRKSTRITHNRSWTNDCAAFHSAFATRRRTSAWFATTGSRSARFTWRLTAWCIAVVLIESPARISEFKKRRSSATIPEATTTSW